MFAAANENVNCCENESKIAGLHTLHFRGHLDLCNRKVLRGSADGTFRLKHQSFSEVGKNFSAKILQLDELLFKAIRIPFWQVAKI